ncbi:MAG: MFS transporter [Chlamydiales bacterium]|nr:MFS transporter [Chlamydiales bacterium]
MSSKNLSLSVLLLSAFIDYAGIAIVFTLFAFLLFDPSLHFLPADTSETVRGVWLGLLIALHPLMQFFSAPIFGAASDRKGRKKVLVGSLWLCIAGYLLAVIGVHMQSIFLLALYRILVGIGAGNSSVIAAMTADLSTPEDKGKNFGLLSMSMGAGFIVAPFLSSLLSKHFGYIVPFYFPLLLVIANLLLVVWKLKETKHVLEEGKLGLFRALTLMRRAFEMKSIRFVFLAHLLFSVGWSFFIEFIALFLRKQFDFDASDTGIFYGYGAVFYALSAGFLVFPMMRWIGASRTLFLGHFMSGLGIIAMLFIHSRFVLWLYVPIAQMFLSFIYPATSTVISNATSEKAQGEALGISHAVNALALGVSPFFVGTFVGPHPSAAVLVGGGMMLIASLVFGLFHYRRSQIEKPLVRELN